MFLSRRHRSPRALVGAGLVRAGVLSATLAAGPLAALAADPKVEVSGAWARSTVKGQTASVVYMTVTSAAPATLVGASSPVAAVVRLHETAVDGTVMKMHAVDTVDLPAATPVEFRSGGLHVMLQDLRQPLVSGAAVPLLLRIRGDDQRVLEQAVSVDVRDAAPMMKRP